MFGPNAAESLLTRFRIKEHSQHLVEPLMILGFVGLVRLHRKDVGGARRRGGARGVAAPIAQTPDPVAPPQALRGLRTRAVVIVLIDRVPPARSIVILERKERCP